MVKKKQKNLEYHGGTGYKLQEKKIQTACDLKKKNWGSQSKLSGIEKKRNTLFHVANQSWKYSIDDLRISHNASGMGANIRVLVT